jgi:uncharacterized phage protein (TIGR02218 family)
MKQVNSAFFELMQADGVNMAELIDLETPYGNFYWTSANVPITYTLSGNPTTYQPFPGRSEGVEEAADLAVTEAQFTFANTGNLGNLAVQDALAFVTVKVGRIHVSTPDLGRMEIFHGQIGDMSVNRQAIMGEVRNLWKSLSVRWPYYSYKDRCAWRFGSSGCGFDTSSITIAGSIIVGSSTTLALHCANTLLSQSYSNGRFNFGRVTIAGGVNSGAVRTIRVHTGDLIFLSHALPINSMDGLSFNIFPGCNKRFIEDCTSLYNNSENFLGFPWIPVQEDAF